MALVKAKKQPFSLERLLEQTWFLLLVAAGSLLGALMVRFYAKEAYREPFGAFFDAFFIAAFLSLAVDPVLKRGFFKGASKDVFALIYGYNLPQELQRFFDRTIIGTKVVRRNCELEWTLRKHPTAPDRVKLELHASFDLLNFTRDNYEYTHQVSSISNAPDEVGSVEFMYCSVLRDGGKEYCTSASGRNWCRSRTA